MPKIQFKRGLESKLPVLAEGEPGFTTDSQEFYIGSENGNVQFAKSDDLTELQTELNSQLANKANADEVNAQLADIVQISLKSFGAVGDGVADDTNAFQQAKAHIDLLNRKVKLFIPNGTYILKSTIHFLNEISIEGEENTWIDYQGTGIMWKLGKDGITETDFQNYKRFEVKNIGFRNGRLMTNGLHFNKWVTQPRVIDCNFEDFGNPDGWGIYFDDDCWDGLVTGCRWDSKNDGIAKNFVRMFGDGNSRVRIFDNLITSLVGAGTALYLNGFNNQVSRNKIEGFAVDVRLGGLASNSIVTENYFEKAGAQATGCIEIGSLAGDNGETTTPIGIVIERNYCNTHLVSITTPSYFIKPTKNTDLIKQLLVAENYVNSYNASGLQTELVNQNNLAGQTGNIAYNNTTLNIDKLHTEGANITGWNGSEGVRREYNPRNELDRYDDIFMGRTKNNNTGQRIRRFDGGVLYQLLADASNNTTISNNGNTMIKYFSDGGISFGKASKTAKFDFNGEVKATHYIIESQKTPATVVNGSMFEDADGKLKYKNLAGTVIDLTL